jgi:hypothetical protein
MHAYDRFLPEWFNRVREAAGQRLAQPYEPGSPRTGSGAASGCSSPGPRGFERAVAFAFDEAPKRIVRPAARRRMAAAEEAVGGCAESGRSAGACEGRQEEAPPQPRGGPADHRGDETAVGRALGRPKRRRLRSLRRPNLGVNRAARRIAAKKSTPIAPRKAVAGRRRLRPAAERAQGGIARGGVETTAGCAEGQG